MSAVASPIHTGWAIKALRDEPLPLFAAAAEREIGAIAEQQEPEVELRQMTDGHNVIDDYSHTGLTLRQPPIAFLRKDLSARNIITCAEAMSAREGRWVSTARILRVVQALATQWWHRALIVRASQSS